MTHEDPEYMALAHRFGEVAEQYERARPTYPSEMVSDLLAAGPTDILDVGCGTGKATRLFTGGGRSVLGVEHDPRMAEVARRSGLEVEVAAFEEWEPKGRNFDLIVSGQAWHWVDPIRGAAKAAQVLRPGGRMAAFWNEFHHRPDVKRVFAEVYGRYAPEMLKTSFALGIVSLERESDTAAKGLVAAGFEGIVPGERIFYDWTVEYTPEAWVNNVATHSDHRLLAASVREPLLRELVEDLARLGKVILVDFRTALLLGIRT